MRGKLFGEKGKTSTRLKIVCASVLGCVLTLQLGAFSVVIETSLSGITELPFGAFAGLMLPIHLAIGLVEGLITSAVLIFVYESRPELLMDVQVDKTSGNKLSFRTTLIILAAVALVTGGGLSLLASSNPDGLEWTIFGNKDGGYSENMGLDEEDYGKKSDMADRAASVQEKTAFLPDYAFSGDEENPAGTTVSGIVGSVMVAGVALLICLAGGFFRMRNKKKA